MANKKGWLPEIAFRKPALFFSDLATE